MLFRSSLLGGVGSNSWAIDTQSGTLTLGDAVNVSANQTKIVINNAHNEIQLNSVDITTNSGNTGNPVFSLPVQYTNSYSDSYNYSSPNNWQVVSINGFNIPSSQFTNTSTSQIWKMDFAMNCNNMSIQDDKFYAMYIQILDSNSNSFEPNLFNHHTPFTTYKNPSQYSDTSNRSENYCWTDWIDMSGCQGSPLSINVWIYAGQPITADYAWSLTLSKTNIV